MTTSDIRTQVKEVYGVEVSEGTVSNVTGRILEHVKEWQNRDLEAVYYVVWMDGIMLWNQAQWPLSEQVHLFGHWPEIRWPQGSLGHVGG